MTPEVTPEMTPEAPADAACNGPEHPVGQAIAETFGVPYDEVMAFHCSGMGFGNIVRAYSLAKASGGNAKDYLERHQKGEGWGNIRKESGVDATELAPGQVLKPGKKGDATQPTAAPQTGPGNNGNGGDKKDKDKDQGNNGNGNGNGNDGGGNGNSGGKGGGKK
ncbi:MAG TPA: hypothetical protein VHO69_04075 [Phototrophicaceae bacterium]|nr:hypothetical protein [Phototrophicaceae bacterium]